MQMNQAKKEKLAELFGTLSAKGQFNGAVLVAEAGEILLEAAYGAAELQLSGDRRLTIDSMFELASVSKPITATAVALLAQQGHLHVDDGIERWLPDFPYPGITIRHLLTHTSGLPDYMELFLHHWDQTKIATNEDVLRLLMEYKPDSYFPPNEQWRYSNTGYVLLAVIVERVTGRSFAEYMREHVFLPLGMDRTRVYNRRYSGELIEDYAYGYVHDARSGEHKLPDHLAETGYVVYLDGIEGDGTVNSTVRDLYRFDQALYGELLLDERMKAEAYAPVRLGGGETIDYGFGWMVEQHPEKGTIVSHHGGWPGYSTSLIRYVDSNKTLICLSNMEQGYEFDQAVVAAAEWILFDEPYEIPERPPLPRAVAVDASIYARYAGGYRFEGGPAVAITQEADRLYIQVEGQVRLELYASSETRSFVRPLPVEVEFVAEGADGVATGFRLYQNGEEQWVVREA